MSLLLRQPLPDRPTAPERASVLALSFAMDAAASDREGRISKANFDHLHEAGLLNLTVPTTLGGAGADLAEVTAVVGWIAQGDASTALILAMHLLHVAAIFRSVAWPKPLAERVARSSIEGVALVNALRVEPELGTPARGGLPATVAQRVANGWRLKGRKIYSTGSSLLRWALVWARTDEAEPRTGLFLVPMDRPGIRIVETWNHLGMRATGSHDIVFDAVEIPADHAVDLRLPKEWGGPDPVQAAWNTLTISALYDGIARAARDWFLQHLKSRTPSNLGASLATLARFQEAVGEIEAWLMVNRRLIAGATGDLSALTPAEAGLIKRTVTGNAIKSVERALELSGNRGLDRAAPLERHYRDVLCSRIHTPQDDSILLAAGRAALGL